MRRCLGAIALAAVLAAAVPAAAVPFTVRIGTERVVLAAPPGFSDTTELASPRLQEIGESLTSASNRILLFALTDTDLRRFMNGDSMEAKRHLIVATPKALERDRVTAEQFAGLVATALRDLGKPPPEDYLKSLEKQPPGSPSLLAELKREATVFSVLQGARLPSAPVGFFSPEKPPQYVLYTTTLLLTRGKALQLTALTGYDGAADLDWLKGITERWINELLRLNR